MVANKSNHFVKYKYFVASVYSCSLKSPQNLMKSASTDKTKMNN